METYHKNPRQITEKQFSDLKGWLRELGDLSGIVHDLNSNETISGNQRARVVKINECKIVLVEEHEPDEQGTVALGYVIWEGNRYNYRQVRWTPDQCSMGNIIANKAGGDWDWDLLANQFEINDLLDWGFSDFDLSLNIIEPLDFSDLDEETESLNGYEEEKILIYIPAMHKEDVVEWLANGESKTGPGMGKGVLKRCGLL